MQRTKTINWGSFLQFAPHVNWMYNDIVNTYFEQEDREQNWQDRTKKRKMSDPSNERKIYYLQKDQQEMKARVQALEAAFSDLIRDCEAAGMITDLLEENNETESDDPEQPIAQDHCQTDQQGKIEML